MEFQGYSISAAALGAGYHRPAIEYGARAYRVSGQDVDVVYLDVGNGWSGIISVIPHNGDEGLIISFWHRLMDLVHAGEDE